MKCPHCHSGDIRLARCRACNMWLTEDWWSTLKLFITLRRAREPMKMSNRMKNECLLVSRALAQRHRSLAKKLKDLFNGR